MKKTIVFLADGFEDVEALGVVDYLRRSNVEVTTLSVTDSEKVCSAHNVTVLADDIMDKRDTDDYDAVIFPGGGKGAEILREDKRILKIVKDYFDKGKLVAAICAAPTVLDKAGILECKNFTVYPSMKDMIKHGKYTNLRAVMDGNIITGSGPGATFAFSHAIVAYLINETAANDTALAMLLV